MGKNPYFFLKKNQLLLHPFNTLIYNVTDLVRMCLKKFIDGFFFIYIK